MTFEAELLDALGTAEDSFDIKAMVRRCFFYDFEGYPIRVWDGQGVLTAGGYDWLGTIDANGTNHHTAPAVADARDGTSPRYEFTIPYLDKTTFDALKADQDLAKGRDLTVYHVLFKVGDGLVPTTALRFGYKLIMRGTKFSEAVQGDTANPTVIRSASVLARSLEYGRARLPNGIYNSTSQKERARVLGVTADSGCDFVAANSRRTYIAGG